MTLREYIVKTIVSSDEALAHAYGDEVNCNDCLVSKQCREYEDDINCKDFIKMNLDKEI